MTSKSVASMTTVTGTELKAMLKLVQRATETIKEMWIQDCVASFGWEPADAAHIVDTLRRTAKRELAK